MGSNDSVPKRKGTFSQTEINKSIEKEMGKVMFATYLSNRMLLILAKRYIP